MATLKISELSVGDWVQDMDGNYVKVAGIWQGCNFNYQVDLHRDGVIGTIVPCNIHPIPITAEILEANGFEENCGSWYNSEVRMEFECYKDGWCRTVNCGEYSVYFIKYVHQLQHVLRLAGVDKEINL